MEFLIFAQTLFYLVVSIVVILFGIMMFIITWHTIKIAKHLHRLSDNLESASKDVQETITAIIEILASLPLVSFLFKKAHSRSKRK